MINTALDIIEFFAMGEKELKVILYDFYTWIDDNAIYSRHTTKWEDIDEYLKYLEKND